jgi:glucan 1,3-beta-glucosidase
LSQNRELLAQNYVANPQNSLIIRLGSGKTMAHLKSQISNSPSKFHSSSFTVQRFSIALLILFTIILQPACATTSEAQVGLPFLHAQGDHLADDENHPVLLKGCNLGNYLMIEPWMLGGIIQATDQAQIFSTWRTRFGEERAQHLIDLYRDGYITPRDFAQIKSFGFNVARLPFDYRILQNDTAPYSLKPDAFHWLDKTVAMARDAGVYVILDLHGAPGGQSEEMHTGQAGQNHLWDNPANQDRTVALWGDIATHFKNESTVAAYDLLNEPYSNHEQDVRPILAKLMPRIYTAIRSVDSRHVMFFPGALNGGVEFYGNPHEKNWQNVGFTEHYYAGLFGDTPALESHARVLERQFPAKLAQMQAWQTPYYVGEFNVVLEAAGGPRVMRAYYDYFAHARWTATMWSYKLLKTQAGSSDGAWYMVTNADPLPTLDLQNSSYEDFKKLFASLGAMPLAVNERLRTALTEPNPSPLILRKYAKLPEAAPPTDPELLAHGGLAGYHLSEIDGATGSVVGSGDGSNQVIARGGDIFGATDSFVFISKSVLGNSTLIARMLNLAESDQYAKAGLMARWGNSNSAAFSMINAFPDGTIAFVYRPEPRANTTEIKIYAGLPVDLKLSVANNVVHAFYRPAEASWQQLGQTQVPAQDNYQIGLATTSHANLFTTARFQLPPLPPLSPSTNSPAQLLINPSFAAANGWNSWGDSMQHQALTSARTGQFALVCGRTANPSGIWQNVKVIAGQRYTLRIQAQRIPTTHHAGTIELRLEGTEMGKQITLNSATFPIDALPEETKGVQLTLSATAINQTMRALVIYAPEGSGETLRINNAELVSQQDSN